MAGLRTGQEKFSEMARGIGFCFVLFFLGFLTTPCGMRGLSSLTRDLTCAPCSGSAEP